MCRYDVLAENQCHFCKYEMGNLSITVWVKTNKNNTIRGPVHPNQEWQVFRFDFVNKRKKEPEVW